MESTSFTEGRTSKESTPKHMKTFLLFSGLLISLSISGQIILPDEGYSYKPSELHLNYAHVYNVEMQDSDIFEASVILREDNVDPFYVAPFVVDNCMSHLK
jgi:hypothetical protein